MVEIVDKVRIDLEDFRLREARDEDVPDLFLLVPPLDGLGECHSELEVVVEDLLHPVEENVHLGLAEDGRTGLLQGQLVVAHQSVQGGEVVVLAVDEAGHDVPPLGLLRGEEEWGGRE